ncbi:hypothetical protein [Methyloglobulus sp.]|uniref:hypothetical protein n=1 Tax=Methyloglobulus sp. TaxID=2518622 RepID=UPI00398A0C92
MHHHLELVKTMQPHPKFKEGEIPHISDMDIIFSQALLMDAGSVTFKAIKSGEIAEILAGLVALAYTAIQALAMQDKDIAENQGEGHQAYQMLAIMRLLSEKVYHCSSGQGEHYSGLYHLCASLSSGFLNADFNKAFQVYHEWREVCQDSNDEANKMHDPHKIRLPDMADCLYE